MNGTVPLCFYYCMPHPNSGESWDLSILANCNHLATPGLVQAGMNIAADVAIFVLPLPIVFRLQMTTAKKLSIAGVFMTALLYVCTPFIIPSFTHSFLPRPSVCPCQSRLQANANLVQCSDSERVDGVLPSAHHPRLRCLVGRCADVYLHVCLESPLSLSTTPDMRILTPLPVKRRFTRPSLLLACRHLPRSGTASSRTQFSTGACSHSGLWSREGRRTTARAAMSWSQSLHLISSGEVTASSTLHLLLRLHSTMGRGSARW